MAANPDILSFDDADVIDNFQLIKDIVIKESQMTDEMKEDMGLNTMHFDMYTIDTTVNIDQREQQLYFDALDAQFQSMTEARSVHKRDFGMNGKKVTFLLYKLYKLTLVDGRNIDPKDELFLGVKTSNIIIMLRDLPTIELNEKMYNEYKKFIIKCTQEKTYPINDKIIITDANIKNKISNPILSRMMKESLSDFIKDDNSLRFVCCILTLYNINFRNFEEHIEFLRGLLKSCNYENYQKQVEQPKKSIFSFWGHKYLKYKHKYMKLKRKN